MNRFAAPCILFLVGLVGCALPARPAVDPHRYLLLNANVITLDPANPRAEAIAVDHGLICAVGSADSVRSFAKTCGTWMEIDLAGKTVIPGLIDAHGHLASLGRQLDPDFVDARDAASPAEAAARVRAVRDRTKSGWILGRNWDQNRWSGEWAGRWPRAFDLDMEVSDRPVWLRRVDGHAGWANSTAIKLAGITDATPDPAGGKIHRDSAGKATGVFIDSACALIEGSIPAPRPDELMERIRRAADECVKHGLTGMHDAGVDRDTHLALIATANSGKLPLRVHCLLDGKSDYARAAVAKGAPETRARGNLTTRAIKLMADGALGSRGAALLEPYSDEPGTRGLVVTPRGQLERISGAAMSAGWQVCIHAIGDAAVRESLDVFDALLHKDPSLRGLRPRIEHAQVVALEDFARFARIGVIASVQPVHAVSDMPWAPARLGPSRIRGAYAYRELADSGARLAGGSDFPVESVNPFLGIHAAVTRGALSGDPSRSLSREQALRLFTVDAAYAAFNDDEVGSIKAGLRADLVIIDRDPLTCAESDIATTVVERTIVDGTTVHLLRK